MTSQQVADLLKVSRPYVVKLATRGELPYYRVGNRHRFARADVLAYKRRRDRHTERALTALAPDEGYQSGDF
jgi:excisionase family DNA binding protein